MNMVDETQPLNGGARIRRAFTIDESNLRTRRSSAANVAGNIPRRRSSNFSELSLSEARKAFRTSTDDLLLPRPSNAGRESSNTTAWHSAPLAFALLPAIGGMLFKNGSSIITDVMLLGLAAIFLNWSVRLPWDWYHSAQAIRIRQEYTSSSALTDDSEEESLPTTSEGLAEVPEEDEGEKMAPQVRLGTSSQHELATKSLYRHESFALLSCFVFPLFGAYLLHTIRSQLSRPSEGLVSNYNLTIFMLASELRPMAHLVKLIQARTLHLQRIVNTNPYVSSSAMDNEDAQGILQRLEALEAHTSLPTTRSSSESALAPKQTNALVGEVRKALGPDIDALNRATRRYEKRATLQAFQTDSKLQELEARLNDAISLAAAAANSAQRPHGFTGIIVEWASTAIVLPLQGIAAAVRLPFTTLKALIGFGDRVMTRRQMSSSSAKMISSRSPSHSKNGDRLQGRVLKR